MRACFIAETPYHILTCVRIANSIDMPKDIYIVNLFSDSEYLVDRIKSLGIFEGVYYVKDLSIHSKFNFHFANVFRMYLLTFFHYLFLNKYIKNKAPNIDEYTHIYNCHRIDFFPRLVFLYCCKYKYNEKLYFYDDGIGSYKEKTELYNPSKFGVFIDYLFSRGKSTKTKYSLLLNSPHFASFNIDRTSYIKNIYKIQSIKRTSVYDELFLKLYGDNCCSKVFQKFIFLDDVRLEVFNKDGLCFFKKLTYMVNEDVGINNIIYKMHPRDDAPDLSLPYMEGNNIPFEAFAYFNDISNKVLIAYFSTSLFTPKMLFDEEPYLIFLCGIMQGYELYNSNNMTICENFKKTYKNPNKIFIPKTLDELSFILQLKFD